MASNGCDELNQEDLTDLQETFENAAKYLKKLVGDLETEQLLYLYARFKQVKEGKCNTQRPGIFDFQGKQKWDAWHSLGDMPSVVAMQEYVHMMNELDAEWQLKLDDLDTTPGNESWVSVSTLQPPDDHVADDDKTVFDWCKEGDVTRTEALLNSVNVNHKDEEGLTLLHWACDRGLDDMVRALLNHDADVDSQDNEGQTPLHYAAACEHLSVARTLLAKGANVKIPDADGLTPADVAESETMATLIASR